MYLQVAILLFLMLIVIGLVVWFYNAKRAMGQVHNQNVAMLESAIYNNCKQLKFRTLQLNRYDFLKYNLDEALVVQSDINL
ncbi:hypothetical protein K8089_05725 [Aequorivita sp. F47161]|uniref:Uncharacterized protein n=1 Tax=Aequorivita vitellina TaxID=2874475 RepID=A0A9X1QUD6_9FLAO|nr:hypothetical protein [Aequorivita vitellina]MCG2418515.1 hypothetical protein [Aequorivita vitellina]